MAGAAYEYQSIKKAPRGAFYDSAINPGASAGPYLPLACMTHQARLIQQSRRRRQRQQRAYKQRSGTRVHTDMASLQ
jgi:hypothetical protein